DLQPRIQVALLNIMQERDIQIRGFKVRIPLDVAMIFSANPEDYTSRGNIITPLKDRIDSQILTHYPRRVDTGMEITRQEAWTERESEVEVEVPDLMREVIEQVAFEARNSEYIDQNSGVSTRLTITAMEQVISSAERRALVNGESSTTVRVSDIFHMVPALTGKLELVYEGEQEGPAHVARHVIGRAVKQVFTRYFPDPQEEKKENGKNVYKPLLDWFANGNELELPDHLDLKSYRKKLQSVNGLESIVKKYGSPENKEHKLVIMDLVLEALHQHSMLGKEDMDDQRSYSDMLGSMLGSMDDFDEYDDFE
ncbi:MAG: magnesium chelatase, partial [Balneolaceae bacterium]|nr:magnesium chelatase [Balneolaceae bacterium]